MKRKIIALSLILTLMPGTLFAAGLLNQPKVETKQVAYYSNPVSIDGIGTVRSVKIDDEVYISANALAGILNKDVTYNKNGNVTLTKKEYNFDFAKGNWGQSKEQIIKNEGRNPDKSQESLINYLSTDAYGQIVDIQYNFKNNKLDSGYIYVHVTDNNCLDMYKHMTNLLYEQFDSIDSKEVKMTEDCTPDMNMVEAIKNGYCHLEATYSNNNTEAAIYLQKKLSGGIELDIGFYRK